MNESGNTTLVLPRHAHKGVGSQSGLGTDEGAKGELRKRSTHPGERERSHGSLPCGQSDPARPVNLGSSKDRQRIAAALRVILAM